MPPPVPSQPYNADEPAQITIKVSNSSVLVKTFILGSGSERQIRHPEPNLNLNDGDNHSLFPGKAAPGNGFQGSWDFADDAKCLQHKISR